MNTTLHSEEGKIIKKTLLTIFLVFLSVVMVYGYADAIGGVCSNCHTMHNSQNGVAIDAGGPNNQLLKGDCVGCHTQNDAGTQTNSFGAPIVLHTTAPTGQGGTQTLAAGDFYWVDNNEVANAALGHNVADLPNVDNAVKDTNMPDLNPPGWDPVATSAGFVAGQVNGGVASWSVKLRCAGINGCHGNHTGATSLDGIQGAHHSNVQGGGSDNAGAEVSGTEATLATTIGNSYRFLWGIKGLEDENWNFSEDATLHNEYYGEDSGAADRSAGGVAAYGSRDTISFLCAECHGLFHGTINSVAGSNAPWIRHPTDIDLPTGGTEFDEYNNDGGGTEGDYSVEAPVARPNVPASGSSNVVAAGTDIVMCLSCHRAHGSPEPDMLRWTYTDMIAGGGATNGCFVCHTAKN